MKAPPLICACCTALLVLPLVVAALPARTAQRSRLNFSRKLWQVEVGGPIAVGTVSRPSVAVSDLEQEHLLVWKGLLHKEPLPRLFSTLPIQPSSLWTRRRGRRHAFRGTRGRRHAFRGTRGHSQLMRVGCILGTCQVQNLSNRLYQLIGQTGREDTSPINPRSPHSYG